MSDEKAAQLTTRVEHRLVDGIPVRTQFGDQNIERSAVEHDRDEDPTLMLGQLGFYRLAHRRNELPALGRLTRLEAEPIGEPVPILRLHLHVVPVPEVPAELGRDLEDDELIDPGRKATLPSELRELRHDRDQGIGRGLMCEIVDLGTRES